CLFFTALGADERGRRSQAELKRLGIELRVIPDAEPTRRAFTYIDDTGERTITVLGEKLRPRGGDTRLPSRELPTLREAGVQLDALVGSGEDEGELYRPGELDPPPHFVVTTSGGLGGWVQPGGPFRPAPVPGTVE